MALVVRLLCLVRFGASFEVMEMQHDVRGNDIEAGVMRRARGGDFGVLARREVEMEEARAVGARVLVERDVVATVAVVRAAAALVVARAAVAKGVAAAKKVSKGVAAEAAAAKEAAERAVARAAAIGRWWWRGRQWRGRLWRAQRWRGRRG